MRAGWCKLDNNKIVSSWHSCKNCSGNFILRSSVKYLPDGSPQRVCNSSPSPCSSALLGEQPISAVLDIFSVAGSGCIGRSKVPNCPVVLIFGRWGGFWQYMDDTGYRNFPKKWLCSGWSLGVKKQGALEECSPMLLAPFPKIHHSSLGSSSVSSALWFLLNFTEQQKASYAASLR